jgi:hypothetical protein
MQSPQYNSDSKGEKLSVILPIEDYQNLLEELKGLKDIILYDEAMKDDGPSLLADEAFKLIEDKRNKM